jgi:hypothetical protein
VTDSDPPAEGTAGPDRAQSQGERAEWNHTGERRPMNQEPGRPDSSREAALGELLTAEGRIRFLIKREELYTSKLAGELIADDELVVRLAEADYASLLGRNGSLARDLQVRFERILSGRSAIESLEAKLADVH